MASPRGLSGGKTEPPDYILMFSSANVPGIQNGKTNANKKAVVHVAEGDTIDFFSKL